ncbi:MAG: acetylornithine/N-succinyldiaminopimelate aminotransferase, partial [Solirubrobacteraceae bacterium]|nr:acetylornithine/N-succinyldiaminopimelate aminotransferase [Solirubrobacteraceae bacterium]
MTLHELQALEREHVVGAYARQPVEFVRGEGARLWDSDGVEYLDFQGGLAVTSVGHS